MTIEVSRRQLMASMGGMVLGSFALPSALRKALDNAPASVLSHRSTVRPISEIEHVVVLMQENRSFDHYFGAMPGVRGFSDPTAIAGVFKQPDSDNPDGYLYPFHADTHSTSAQNLPSTNHDWAPQHDSWNNGAMNGFVSSRINTTIDSYDGKAGQYSMAYFKRNDIPFQWALADAFTVCDSYFCSVLGPTDPNRIMAMSGTIDPDAKAGGPVLTTSYDRIARYGTLHWQTMPERLQAAGISWKVYNHPLAELALSPLPYFKAFTDPLSVTGFELTSKALTPSWPDDFHEDVAAGRLPAVSWIIPPLAQCEHPAAPPEYGENFVQDTLHTLVANPGVWAQTVMFIVYDENGGFFDHVPPVTPPEGTAGEWLTAPLPAASDGIAGPVGLGFRTPCLVVSPFSRGGHLCSDVFDHTSLLRFIEARFGVEVPNLSAWRRAATGDMTTALALTRPKNTSVPPLPEAKLGTDLQVAEQAVLNALAGTFDVGIPYPIPATNSMPTQEPGPPRPPVSR